jgi:hypothetical protein
MPSSPAHGHWPPLSWPIGLARDSHLHAAGRTVHVRLGKVLKHRTSFVPFMTNLGPSHLQLNPLNFDASRRNTIDLSQANELGSPSPSSNRYRSSNSLGAQAGQHLTSEQQFSPASTRHLWSNNNRLAFNPYNYKQSAITSYYNSLSTLGMVLHIAVQTEKTKWHSAICVNGWVVVFLSIVLLKMIFPSIVLPSIVHLSVVLLSVVLQSVVVLSVVLYVNVVLLVVFSIVLPKSFFLNILAKCFSQIVFLEFILPNCSSNIVLPKLFFPNCSSQIVLSQFFSSELFFPNLFSWWISEVMFLLFGGRFEGSSSASSAMNNYVTCARW